VTPLGTTMFTTWSLSRVADNGTPNTDKRGIMVASKPSSQEAGSWMVVDEGNVIGVTFGDLFEEDQCQIKEEMRHELEVVEVAKLWEKLSCYQKMRNGVV
jgi:hypothetical protein